MKGLATLIKLHKRTLDELRRKMATLENQKEQLELLARALRDEMAHEMELVNQSAEIQNYFANFARRMQMRQNNVREEIRALERQMEKLRTEIAAAYAELKKCEIAQENVKQLALQAARRKDTIELDEIAGQQHQRKRTTEDQ